METVSRVKKVGGSLMIRIPKEIAKEENLKEGQIVKIEVKKLRKSYFGVLKGMKPYKREKFSDFDR